MLRVFREEVDKNFGREFGGEHVDGAVLFILNLQLVRLLQMSRAK
jgi:hypothetical protein